VTIPDSALQQHLVILGKTGSGKSWTARGIVERLLDLGRRVCILDYTGVWSGLRSNAAGNGPGYPVVIFGGDHADVPLTEAMAAEVARFVASETVPTIIDLDGMTVGAQHRFVTAFCEELYRANSGPLHLVIEEIDELAPQTGAPGAERMIGAVCRIFQRGRSKGFRAVAITQRPANVHKRVLAQCNTMIALRLVAPQDRKAIADWIRGHGDDAEGKRVIDSLPRLARGEGWIWAPEQDVLSRTTFPPIKTFDSMRAPEDGEERQVVNRAAIDLPAIRDRFATAEAEVQQNDPKALKARIAELERQAGKQGADPAEVERARQAGYQAGYIDGQERGQLDMHAAAKNDLALIKEYANLILGCADNAGIRPELRSAPTDLPKSAHTPNLTPSVQSPIPAPSGSHLAAKRQTPESVTAAQQRVLDAVAWWRKIGQDPADRDRACVVAGYSPKASTFGVYVSQLVKMGLLETLPGKIALTPAGLKAANTPTATTREDLYQMARALLGPQEQRVFDVVYRAWPKDIRRDTVAEKVGLSPTASTAGVYMSAVSAYGLIEAAGRGTVKAADWLFP
jgi:hypothetical protein